MSSFHIMCKKRKGLSMRNLKVLIWSVPQKIRVRKERRMKLLRVQIKRILRKMMTVSFARHIFVGDEKSVEVEAIGHFRLLLGSGLYLDLKDTFIIPSFRWNLVFIFLLDKFGYHCSFENNQFSLSLNSNIVGTGSLSIFDNFICLTRLYHIMKPCM